jgi:isochorismate synthase
MRLPKLQGDDELTSTEGIDFLSRALRSPLPRGQDILVVAIPAPIEAPEKFLRVTRRDDGFLWRSPTSAQLAGSGATAKLTGRGPSRFAQLRDAARTFWPRVCTRSFGNSNHVPTLVGGAAFVEDPPDLEPWSDFAVDTFTLARWGYRRERDNAHLTVSVRADELAHPKQVNEIIDEAWRLLAALEREAATTMIQKPEINAAAVHHMSPGEWTEYIDAVQAAIASGRFDKIVAARRCVVNLPNKLEDTAFMARLFAAYADCTHFALTRPEVTFLGVTPETLLRRRGSALTTHALAGTVRVTNDLWDDSSAAVAELGRSSKNLDEHAYVVRKITDDLARVSKRVEYANVPQTRRVRDLIHLQTPISCELRDGVDVFELVEMLHPTPAVSGCPAKEAALWLRDNEPIERGLYTGTVGWFDPEGNAEFAVAIRCGVLTERRVHIYAGAGIVKDSDADAEYRETGAKMAPILRALGVQI